MIIKLQVVGAVILILHSCVPKSNCLREHKSFLFLTDDKKNANYILFIPLEGCNSCIKKSLEFAHKVEERKDFQVVLSHYDKKAINIMIANYNLQLDNIFCDLEGNAIKYGLMSSNPSIYDINNCQQINLQPSNIDQIFRTFDQSVRQPHL